MSGKASLWSVWWIGGVAITAALAVLARLSDQAWHSGHPQLAVFFEGARLPAYWVWAVGVYRACDATLSAWVPLARAGIVAGAVLTVLT
jgi:hypothetical protein